MILLLLPFFFLLLSSPSLSSPHPSLFPQGDKTLFCDVAALHSEVLLVSKESQLLYRLVASLLSGERVK